MTDGRLMRSMLLDFYGELLTERQRECYDLHYNDDLSLAEIAEQSGVSRQCVWDNIRRAEASLQEIEKNGAYPPLFGDAGRPRRRGRKTERAVRHDGRRRAHSCAVGAGGY